MRPGHFSQRRERRAGTHSWPLKIRPTRNGTKQQRQGETRIAQPGRLHQCAGTHAPVPLQAAACARGYPWASSTARPTPPHTPRVPKQLLYLLNLATAGY